MLEKYAQEISDTTSKIIGYHVLVTDKQGIVIGSSNPERLGKSLFEAPQVIRSRKGYIVSEEEALQVNDTKPGVTYPIEDVDGRITGTIAIAGDPDKVTPFALIVKKQAEMYLREKAFLETALNRERTVQIFMKDVLAFDPRISGKEALEQRACEFGYDKKWKYVPIYVKYQLDSSGTGLDENCLLYRRAESLLRSVFAGRNDISACMGKDVILLFHALPNRNQQEDETFRIITGKCLNLEKLMAGQGFSAFLGIGSIVSDLEEWGKSYMEAMQVLERGRIFYPSRKVFIIRDHRLHEMVASARKDLRSNFAGDQLSGLNSQRDRLELKETIEKWCQCNFSVRDTSEELHIHRNTLHYRIDKIEKICGFGVRDFTRMMELYLALQLEKINLLESSS